MNLCVAHQNTASYDKWSQQQEQQREKTLQRQNKHWDAECYQLLAAADEEADRAHSEDFTGPRAGRKDDDNHHDDSDNECSHHTIHPYHHTTHPYIVWNDWIDDKAKDDEYDNEYDSDNEMYAKNNTIENSIINIIDDKSDVANTTVHTTDHTNKNKIIETSWLPPITNTINESFIYSEINIIEDVPNNNINGKNAAKRKEKASRRKKAASIRRTENTIRDKFFEFIDGKSSNDTDSSNSSNCNCDLHHNCPQHRWEHLSQRTFNYDKTYNYDRVDHVDTYMIDGQDH